MVDAGMHRMELRSEMNISRSRVGGPWWVLIVSVLHVTVRAACLRQNTHGQGSLPSVHRNFLCSARAVGTLFMHESSHAGGPQHHPSVPPTGSTAQAQAGRCRATR